MARQEEITISSEMVKFWENAVLDWQDQADRAKSRKDYKSADFYDILADKAERQKGYILDRLSVKREKYQRIGTHGKTTGS